MSRTVASIDCSLSHRLLSTQGLLSSLPTSSSHISTMSHPEESGVKATLLKYQDALNASSTPDVMALYTHDGIFMPQHFHSSTGTAAIQQAYEGIFKAIQLTVKFNIEEVHVVAPEWAFARTTSAGTTKVHATGAQSAEGNQELFVMHNVHGHWKIARYCFCTTNPPPQQ